jgi:amidase
MTKYISTNYITISTSLQLHHITLSDVLSSLRYGNITPEHLVLAYLTRTAEVNLQSHAIIETNPAAIDDARLLGLERSIHGSRGSLHGVPILLNIPTLDNTETTCGPLALVGAKSPREADVVTALRKAGTVILGKGI